MSIQKWKMFMAVVSGGRLDRGEKQQLSERDVSTSHPTSISGGTSDHKLKSGPFLKYEFSRDVKPQSLHKNGETWKFWLQLLNTPRTENQNTHKPCHFLCASFCFLKWINW